jgi:predicted outer membrane protein
MRVLVAIVMTLVLAFISTAAFADSTGEQMRGDRTPNATDVITGLYAFSRFQQGLLESTDLKGNAEVKNLAALRAEEAAKRDRTLKEIQETIGAEPRVSKTTSANVSLAEPESTDGPSYVRIFYAAQIPEYESAISLIERYLRAPDNAALGAFAREQLPVLRSQLEDAERTAADK